MSDQEEGRELMGRMQQMSGMINMEVIEEMMIKMAMRKDKKCCLWRGW